MVNGITIEICIGNIQDALTASRYPVDRIELNSAIELGGLTPTLETLRFLRQRIPQKICCMVRPRGGDFCYSEIEYQTMLKDARLLLENGADGIVFGFLKEDSTVDEERTVEMTRLIHSYHREAVFHKAFDDTRDMEEAIKLLIDCGIERILTSGQAKYPYILDGCWKIRALKDKYGDLIQLLPGGGVRIENAADVLRVSNCRQIHMTSKKQYPGGYLGLDEDQLQQILEEIRKI